MKDIKIIIDGKEIAATIDDAVRQQLLHPVKKTGYERVAKNEASYTVFGNGKIDKPIIFQPDYYDAANYYSDKTVAENNARADKLMRQLRRFAVEHRKKPIDWTSPIANLHEKWEIMYSCPRDAEHKLYVTSLLNMTKGFGRVYFDEYSTALLAIDTFKDELIWYFTEYKDSL